MFCCCRSMRRGRRWVWQNPETPTRWSTRSAPEPHWDRSSATESSDRMGWASCQRTSTDKRRFSRALPEFRSVFSIFFINRSKPVNVDFDRRSRTLFLRKGPSRSRFCRITYQNLPTHGIHRERESRERRSDWKGKQRGQRLWKGHLGFGDSKTPHLNEPWITCLSVFGLANRISVWFWKTRRGGIPSMQHIPKRDQDQREKYDNDLRLLLMWKGCGENVV